VRLRDLDAAADRAALERLWRVALAPGWPVLPDGLDLVSEGLVAERDGQFADVVMERLGSRLARAPGMGRDPGWWLAAATGRNAGRILRPSESRHLAEAVDRLQP